MGRRQPQVEDVALPAAPVALPADPLVRHLRWVGVLVPVLAVAGLHLLRPVLATAPEQLLVLDVTIGVLALVFGLTVLALVDRAYRLVLDRNRELAAVDADRQRLVAGLLAAERDAAVVAERERIAREMHDSLAQVLGVTHLRLRAALAAPDLPAGTARELGELAEICHDGYLDVREAILGLREASRPERGLLDSLRVYVEKFARQSGVPTTLDSALAGDAGLSPQAEIQIIRVIQEALTNVRKHSAARHATVRVEQDGDHVVFAVVDEGVGFDPAQRRERFGLHTMRERTELVGGTFRIEAAPGRGTRVTAAVPLPGSAPAEVAR